MNHILKNRKKIFLNKKSKNICLWVGSHISRKIANNGQSNIHPEIFHSIEKWGLASEASRGFAPLYMCIYIYMYIRTFWEITWLALLKWIFIIYWNQGIRGQAKYLRQKLQHRFIPVFLLLEKINIGLRCKNWTIGRRYNRAEYLMIFSKTFKIIGYMNGNRILRDRILNFFYAY